jgi:phosphoglucosamine mutase
VLESMLKTGCVIGGEQSGHIIFLNHTTTGDGILSALQLINAVKASGKKLSVLADEITIYPQVLKNAKIKNEKGKSTLRSEISNEIRESKRTGCEGWVMVVPPHEPLVRGHE